MRVPRMHGRGGPEHTVAGMSQTPRPYFHVTLDKARMLISMWTVRGQRGELLTSYNSQRQAMLDAVRLNVAYRLGCSACVDMLKRFKAHDWEIRVSEIEAAEQLIRDAEAKP